jgi:lysophospholipid acyltransferase (LPLAT)-like uncharacterized protein
MKKTLGDRLLLGLAPPLAAGIIRILYFSQRRKIIGQERLESLWNEGQRVIFCFWHDQLLLMIKSYKGPGARILISASRDGELIARTMRCFGYDAVRGSSSRGGRAAFRSMVDLSRQPYDLAITPDGPKGPRHVIKPGVVELARLSGRAVVPLSFVCSRGHRFASWDRFLLPYPLGRAIFLYGQPLRYEPGEKSAVFAERLQQAMEDNQRRAQTRLEESGVSAV